MKHDILGDIEQFSCHPFDATAVVRHRSHDIKIGISQEDDPLETTLNLTAKVVVRLAELDKLARGIAVADFLKTYNDGWNEHDEAQEDGSLKTVTSPLLSETEFEAKLSLRAINVTGDRMISFFDDAENMFWGHSIVVKSLNGVDFTEARAELFG